MIPCDECKPMVLWGTLIKPATHLIHLHAAGKPRELYACESHAHAHGRAGDVHLWTDLRQLSPLALQ